jgi:hypothetical protein
MMMSSLKKWVQPWGAYVGLCAVLLGLSSCQGVNLPSRQAVPAVAVAQTQAETGNTTGHETHTAAAETAPRAESDHPSPIALDPSQGQAIGAIYEAFLSPHQEGGEEEDTPSLTPQQFLSTAPSVPRNERTSRGHGLLSFTKDLSKAFVHVQVEGVQPADVVMFHIHCGRPGQLGPIIIDFALAGNLQEYLADGLLTLELTNADIVAVTDHGSGLVGAFTAGCPIVHSLPLDKVKTIAGMALIAQEGELYFNLHTKGQTFFGDIRGQLQSVAR